MKIATGSFALVAAALQLCLLDTVAAFSASPSSSSAKPVEIDLEKAFAESTFPIAPEALIERTKECLGPKIGVGTKDGGECLADEFEFCAAVVGPIPKEEYLAALGNFQLEDSFDITQNTFGFAVSPMQPNRVFFLSYQSAKLIAPFMGVKPEGDKENLELNLPPQCLHMDFTEDGKIKEFGFYTVDRRYGNTGGLGGAFGYFYGVGKPLPFPEGRPYKKSLRFRLLGLFGRLAQSLSRKKE